MSKRRYKRKKKNNSTRQEFALVLMMIIGILLSLFVYFKSGYIGTYLTRYLGMVIGRACYLLPIGLISCGIYSIYEKNKNIKLKVIELITFIIGVSALIGVYNFSIEKIEINIKMAEIIQKSLYLGELCQGGGLLGVLLAYGLIKFVGTFGAVIIFMAVTVMTFIFMFNIDYAEKLRQLKDEFIDKKEEYLSELEAKKVENGKLARKEKRELKLKAKEEAKLAKMQEIENQKQEASKVDEQLTINGNKAEDIVEEPTKKVDSNMQKLFKQEEEKKEDKLREVLTLEHALTIEDENYEFPPISLLQRGDGKSIRGSKKAVQDTAIKLQQTLHSFGVSAKVENVSVGPAITRYELKPAVGVRVNKIANLADDIALNLAAETIRIEAPIPGKQAVGIEVPNKDNELVHLRDIIETDKFLGHKSKLAFALGKDVAGQEVVADIAKMPHVLIAGATGSGKSVCINTLITSIIYNAKPSEVKLLMIDPKVVELSVYNGIPHLLIPVVTDTKKAAGALNWAVQEMVNRYSLFASKNVRDIKGYNELLDKESGEGKLPQIVIIIDELSDLMMVSPKEVEDSICRLAQMARAAGMHLVIATQRPSVDVITGIIKANIPSRISFAVSSQVDSRTILDMVGAEKLLGKGDMLFYPSGAPKPTRIQGAFISDKEVEHIVQFVKRNYNATYNTEIIKSIENANKKAEANNQDGDNEDDTDELLMDAIDLVVEHKTASTSFIQRKFKVGYSRAGRIIDQMEEKGIISGYQGSKPREVLVDRDKLEELKMAWSKLKKIEEINEENTNEESNQEA